MNNIWEDLQKLGYKIHNKRVLQELELPLKISKETLETDKCMEYALILQWFRDKYGINSTIDWVFYDGFHYTFKWTKPNGEYAEEGSYDTPKKAEFECIKELIKQVKL